MDLRRFSHDDVTDIGWNSAAKGFTVVDGDFWNGQQHDVVLPTEQANAATPDEIQAATTQRRKLRNAMARHRRNR